MSRPPTIPPSQDQVIPLAFTLPNLQFERAGDYVAVIRIDGIDQGPAPFRVAEMPPGKPAQS